MKKTALAMAIVATMTLAGCSTFSSKSSGIDPGEQQAIKDQRLSTDFEREGVRVFYTIFGRVERIEAYGYAQVWRGDFRHVAEADAKDKLIKFLRGETVDTRRMTRVIARSIERSQDNMLNKFRTVDGTVNTSAEEIEREDAKLAANPDENSKSNTALRKTSVNSAQIVTSTITVTARGRLDAVRKVSGGPVDDGRVYRVVYAWSQKEQDAARSIRKEMDRR